MHTSRTRFGNHANLLRLLLNLRTLSLQPPPYNFQLSMLASSIMKELHLDLSSGKDRNGDGMVQGPLEIIDRVRWMPSLQRLLIEGMLFTPACTQIFQAHQSRSSPVTDLQFRTCGQETIGCLPDIRSCIKELKRFTFEMLKPWESSHGYIKGVEPAILRRAIGLHAKTLVHLEIVTSDAAEFPRTSLFGSLTG